MNARNRAVLRVLVLSQLIAIVPVFQARAAAAAAGAVSEDVPVPGGTAALAQALAIEPVPDRGRFMFEITRLVHENSEIRNPAVAAFLQSIAPSGRRDGRERGGARLTTSAAELVPVPLNADVWSSAVFHRKVAREDLVATIIANRAASLLCHGLAALDDPTLEYLAGHGAVLTKIVERSAGAFAPFAGSLQIRANRVVPPGGDQATPLWEAIVGEKVTRPDRFVPQLFDLNEGRVAYLFDILGQLDPARRSFALGAWIADPAARLARFKALATVGINSFREWHLRAQPFGRASYDLAMTLMRVTVDDRGIPVAPASRAFWTRLFSSGDVTEDPARHLRAIDDEPFDAAWLTEAAGSVDVRQRIDRLNQIAFAQRMFGASAAADRADVFVAIRALSRYRMLMLSLERLGIRSPAVYASAARHAARLGALDGHRGFVAHAEFQGALALIVRMAAVRTLDVPSAQHLIERLLALTLNDDDRYAGAVAQWLRDDLAAAIPRAASIEAAIIAALSGPPSGGHTITRLTWEGQRYKLDLGAAERRRLQIVRDKQEALPIDIALDIAAIGHALSNDAISVDDRQASVERITALAKAVPERARPEEEDGVPVALALPPEAHAILRKAADDLVKTIRSRETKRTPRIAAPLLSLSDDLLSQALLSFAYAVDLGDPDGAILLADDVSRRHDFGFTAKETDARTRSPWTAPHQDVSPGIPWHVTGSLLGLDVALAPLALRRLNYERVLQAPKLTSNQRETFAVSVAFMNPFALGDDQRDAIVDAIDRGRQRVASLAGPGDLDVVAADLVMDGARRRAVAWTFVHDRPRLESLFSLTELLVLGGGRPGDLDAWGMSMLATTGCLCSQLTPPGRWSALSGRPQIGVTAAGIADVNLQVAIMLKQLQLPAALARVVLSAAMQDFIDQVSPTDDADWITMVRAARTITREQVEDYVAAATAAGPLVPDNGDPPPLRQ